MTKRRFEHIRQLAELRENIRQFPTLADDHIRHTIVENLPPAHAKLYRVMKVNEWVAVSENVATVFNIRQNQAADMLRELHEFGLLERQENHNENGKMFVYRVAK